jgi:hypothetical protein
MKNPALRQCPLKAKRKGFAAHRHKLRSARPKNQPADPVDQKITERCIQDEYRLRYNAGKPPNI